MCKNNCIQAIQAELREQPEVKFAVFQLANIKSFKNPNSTPKTGQPIEITISKKRKDGTEALKTQKSFVAHSFCPFCGEKYD